MQRQRMVNPNYDPTDKDEAVLDAFKDGREEGRPWGRANPRWLVENTPLSKGNVEYSLRNLTSAGWIESVAHGQYEFVEDPREENTE